MKELSKQSVKELRQMARELHIKKWYSLKKEDLLKKISDFAVKLPEVDLYQILEKKPEKDTPKRTISWIVLIVLVITVPLLAWWISQPSSSWYQTVLNFFGF